MLQKSGAGCTEDQASKFLRRTSRHLLRHLPTFFACKFVDFSPPMPNAKQLVTGMAGCNRPDTIPWQRQRQSGVFFPLHE